MWSAANPGGDRLKPVVLFALKRSLQAGCLRSRARFALSRLSRLSILPRFSRLSRLFPVALCEGSFILNDETQGSGFAVTLGYTLSPTAWALDRTFHGLSLFAHVTHARGICFVFYTFRCAPRVAITLSACYARRFPSETSKTSF